MDQRHRSKATEASVAEAPTLDGKTICVSCHWYQHRTMDGFSDKRGRAAIWYEQRCRHIANTRVDIDYVNGSIARHPSHCRDVNRDGNCPYFE